MGALFPIRDRDIQAGDTARAGVARQDAHGRGDRGRLRTCRKNLSLAQQDRTGDHRRALVRPTFLRLEPQRSQPEFNGLI